MLTLLHKMEKQLDSKIKRLSCLIAILVVLLGQAVAYGTVETVELDVLNDNFVSIGYDLPLIVIDTQGASISGLELTPANMKIINNKDALNFLGDAPEFQSQIGLKIRGKSSRKFPKKQYRLELWDEDMEDKDASLLGLSKESDWVLYGPFKDKSLIRNAVVYNIADKMMVYAPKYAYCEVFIVEDGSPTIEDKHFKGFYMLMEKIKRSDNRVNIFQSYEELGETSFLASKDVPFYNDTTILTYGRETIVYPREIELNYPNRNVTEAQLTYISRTISEFERVLYSSEYDSEDGGYEDYIEVESFVDFYLINEFFRNTDAGVFSTYFSKDYGEEIRLGPVWDFNECMGNDPGTGAYYEYTGFYLNNDFWFKRLMTDREFVEDLIDRYWLLRRTYLSDAYLTELIDQSAKEIEGARIRNFEKWPFELCNQVEVLEALWVGYLGFEEDILSENIKTSDEMNLIRQYGDAAGQPGEILEILRQFDYIEPPALELARTYDEEIELMKAFVVNRGKWLDDNIELLLRFTY